VRNLLERHPKLKVRVLVVWEPVRHADANGPPTGTYMRIPDRRVVQFWDPQLTLSKRILRDALHNPKLLKNGEQITKSTIVWDIAAVFRQGQRWDRAFPPPQVYGMPVVDVIGDVERELVSQL
jgi:hypothetical protein